MDNEPRIVLNEHVYYKEDKGYEDFRWKVDYSIPGYPNLLVVYAQREKFTEAELKITRKEAVRQFREAIA